MSPVKHVNRWMGRVPIWLAALLLAVPMVTLARWGFVEWGRADTAHGQTAASSEALEDAQATVAQTRRELAKQKVALARANAKLKAVGEKPVDPDVVVLVEPRTAPVTFFHPLLSEVLFIHG